ncbi:glycosyltransferase family 2 protein [Desulfurivibrio sp. D14AmB]|uniref:glycosyltransferase family 2 protein n=1 Tax=Desulfurivibrio sp. D14AmB TaxID=3374370 RepID=UPI00376ED50D
MVEPVSVIIPTHNRADWLKRAIASVVEQDYRPLELLVVDDGSSDHTRQVVRDWAGELTLSAAPALELRYLFQENRGPSAARNLGVRQASHNLLAFLDCDDRFLPGKLAIQAAAMAANSRLPLSHTEEVWRRRGEHLNPKKRHRKEGGDLFARSLELCVIGMSTVMLRRRLLEEVGGFDEELPCCEDYELWLRVTARFPVLFVDLPLTEKHGGRSDQLSVRYRLGMDRFRIKALRKLLAEAKLTAAQVELARRELVRKSLIYGRGCLKHGRPGEGEHYLALAAAASAGLAGPETQFGVDGPEGAGQQEEQGQHGGDRARVGAPVQGRPGEIGR